MSAGREVEPKSSWAWQSLGTFFARHAKGVEAEAAIRRAIEIDPTDGDLWLRLSWVFTDLLCRYVDAEVALRRATELAPESATAWSTLGRLFHETFARFPEAEEAYRKATALDPNETFTWMQLADLLHYRMARFAEAEEAYSRAIAIDPNSNWPWNNLGLLLADCLGRYEDASHAFKRAIEIAPEDSLAPAYNLVSVLRDQLGEIEEAQRICATLEAQDDKALQSAILLHPALFATYSENWGMASAHLAEALNLLADHNAFPSSVFPGWMRATAVLIHLGYGNKLLELLKLRGDDQRLRPWYEAIRAHIRGDRRYLRNIPAEMRDIAGTLYDEIDTRLRNLPDSTRRWSPPPAIKRVASRRKK